MRTAISAVFVAILAMLIIDFVAEAQRYRGGGGGSFYARQQAQRQAQAAQQQQARQAQMRQQQAAMQRQQAQMRQARARQQQMMRQRQAQMQQQIQLRRQQAVQQRQQMANRQLARQQARAQSSRQGARQQEAGRQRHSLRQQRLMRVRQERLRRLERERRARQQGEDDTRSQRVTIAALTQRSPLSASTSLSSSSLTSQTRLARSLERAQQSGLPRIAADSRATSRLQRLRNLTGARNSNAASQDPWLRRAAARTAGTQNFLSCRGSQCRSIARNRYWTNQTQFNGTRVYQRNDLIDPSRLDARGRTNLQRMRSGLAPIGPDGQSINLHHMNQRRVGSLAEMTRTFHQRHSRVIHINRSTRNTSTVDRDEFDRYRAAYWRNRAADFE